jgi:hypothetical protein
MQKLAINFSNNLIQSEMKTILKKPLWFTVITVLLVTVTLFAATGCDKTETPNILETLNISGTWKVKTLDIEGMLTNIGLPPENASNSDISITIPSGTQGSAEGHTFYNTIGFGFELGEHQQISITNYGGSRFTEDEWGMAFRDHIISNVVKFKIADDELHFIDSLDNSVIVFINPLNNN